MATPGTMTTTSMTDAPRVVIAIRESTTPSARRGMGRAPGALNMRTSVATAAMTICLRMGATTCPLRHHMQPTATGPCTETGKGVVRPTRHALLMARTTVAHRMMVVTHSTIGAIDIDTGASAHHLQRRKPMQRNRRSCPHRHEHSLQCSRASLRDPPVTLERPGQPGHPWLPATHRRSRRQRHYRLRTPHQRWQMPPNLGTQQLDVGRRVICRAMLLFRRPLARPRIMSWWALR